MIWKRSSVNSALSTNFYNLLEQGRRKTQKNLGLNNLSLTRYTEMISRSKNLKIPKIKPVKENEKNMFNKRKKRRY